MVSSSILRGAIVVFTLATTAGLSARGAMVLLAASLLPLDPRGLGEGVDDPSVPPAPPRTRSARALAELFELPQVTSGPPTTPRDCPGRLVSTVWVESDPERSLAEVRFQERAAIVRLGDVVEDDWRVTDIGFDDVSLARGDDACRLALYEATAVKPIESLAWVEPCAGY